MDNARFICNYVLSSGDMSKLSKFLRSDHSFKYEVALQWAGFFLATYFDVKSWRLSDGSSVSGQYKVNKTSSALQIAICIWERIGQNWATNKPAKSKSRIVDLSNLADLSKSNLAMILPSNVSRDDVKKVPARHSQNGIYAMCKEEKMWERHIKLPEWHEEDYKAAWQWRTRAQTNLPQLSASQRF